MDLHLIDHRLADFRFLLQNAVPPVTNSHSKPATQDSERSVVPDTGGSLGRPAVPDPRTTFFENCWEHHTWQHTKVARPQPMIARIATKATPLCTNLAGSQIHATAQISLLMCGSKTRAQKRFRDNVMPKSSSVRSEYGPLGCYT